MSLWRVYYHVVWATRGREPLITPEMETTLHGYLIGKANEIECIIHALGGTDDHIHLVASVPPKLAVAEFVKKLKGSSAYYLTHGGAPDVSDRSDDGERTLPHGQAPDRKIAFGWQGGYGLFSLGARQLDQAIAYVQRQKEHHQQGTTIAALEQCGLPQRPERSRPDGRPAPKPEGRPDAGPRMNPGASGGSRMPPRSGSQSSRSEFGGAEQQPDAHKER